MLPGEVPETRSKKSWRLWCTMMPYDDLEAAILAGKRESSFGADRGMTSPSTLRSGSVDVDVDGKAADAESPTTTITTTTTRTSWNRLNVVNVLACFVSTAITSYVGGLHMEEVAGKYETVFTPKGWAVSVDRSITLLELAWVASQVFVPSQRSTPAVFAVGYYYLGVCLAQAGWTLSFNHEVMWLSMLFMLLLLSILFVINNRLREVETTTNELLLWQQFPFSLHYGWIIVATAINVNLVMVAYEASAAAQLWVASGSMLTLLVVAVASLVQHPVDLTYPLVLIWELAGVYSKLQTHLNDSQLITLETPRTVPVRGRLKRLFKTPRPGAHALAADQIQGLQRFNDEQIEAFQNGALVGAAFLLACMALKVVYDSLAIRRKEKVRVQREKDSTDTPSQALPPRPDIVGARDEPRLVLMDDKRRHPEVAFMDGGMPAVSFGLHSQNKHNRLASEVIHLEKSLFLAEKKETKTKKVGPELRPHATDCVKSKFGSSVMVSDVARIQGRQPAP